MKVKSNEVINLLLLFIIPCIIFAQDIAQISFVDGLSLWDKSLDRQINKAYTVDENLVIITRDNSSNLYENNLIILNNAGETIAQKKHELIYDLSIAKMDKSLLVAYYESDSPSDAMQLRVEKLDKNGNEILNISNFTSPHIEISSSGNFIITTQNIADDEIGMFQLYSVADQKFIDVLGKDKYEYFFANFLGEEKVIIVLQPNRKIIRNPISYKIEKYESKPAKLILYNLESQSIELNRELYSSDRKPIWISFYQGYLVTDDNGQHFAIAANNIPREEKESSFPYNLGIYDVNGTLLYEKNFISEKSPFEGIRNLKFIDDNLLLIEKYSVVNCELCLLDIQNKKFRWREKLGPKIEVGFGSYAVDTNHNLLFLSGNKFVYKINYETGQIIDKNSSLNSIIPLNDKTKLVISKKGQVSKILNK